VVVILV
jgi:hypothetical protein